jgi:outer membrane protein insertion porin family
MSMPFLLLLLALAPQEAGVFEGATVTQVTLDLPAEDRLRFSPYIELHAGDALSRERIRHTVEVLYATGVFEDIRVEAERSGDGLDVVFRPLWAPLLRDVKVLGDRVLSPPAVKRTAKLRDQEPLFDLRLEKAARDVAVALTAQGYLEARVEAVAQRDGKVADAVFTVHAGPRVLVEAESVLGAEDEAGALLALARPRGGEVFRRSKALEAADKMRRLLAGEGRWDATVTSKETYDPSRAHVALVFDVRRGRKMALEIRGAALSGRLRSSSESLLKDGGTKVDVLEEVASRVEEDFLSKGYRDVAVAHEEEARPWGTAVVLDVRPGGQARVGSVRVLGAEGVSLREPFLQTRPGEPLQDRLVDQDARNLTRALEDLGYATARVDPEIPEGGGDLPVVFRVRPGPRTLVLSVTIDAQPPPPGVSFESLRVRKGAPYRTRDVALDSRDLTSAYENGGFLRAEVRPEVIFSEDKTEATVTLRASPGPRTTVDHVLITGLVHTKEVVVRRELLVHEGEPLGLQKVLESQRRLSGLGIFARATINEADPESVEQRSLVVHVEEAPRTTIAYGLGYAERDLLRASVDVTRRNVAGLDRSLSLFVRGSFAGNRILMTYREPYPFGRKGEIFLTGFHEEEQLDTFSYSRTGGTLQTARTIASHTSLILRYTFEKTSVFSVQVPLDQVDRQFRDSTFSGPSLSLVNDNRDDPLDPSSGHFVGADVQFSSRGFGGDSFLKGFLQTSTYRALAPRLLLALSARVGLARTFSGEPPELPLPDRFFAGGDYSIRGFAIDTAGPRALSSTGTLLPTGGNALLVGGVELRVDTGSHFQVALFSDLGNVYPLVGNMTLGDIRYTAGLGLRYKSALGPLRIDYGYKLNRRPGDSPGHFHFTVGYAF